MAKTISQKPNLLSPANTPLVYIFTDGDTNFAAVFKYRYVLKLEINGVEKSVLKIHRNGSDVGIFDISHLVRSYIETTDTNQNSTTNTIHSLGVVETAKPFSQNSNQCAKVTVKFFYEYATAATLSPTLYDSSQTSDSYVIPAATPFTKTAADVGGLDIIDVDDASNNNYPLAYFLNSTSTEDSHSFFTNAPNVQFVRGSSTSADNLDLLTICFKQEGLLTDGVAIEYMFVEYYNSSGVIIGSAQSFANSNANGGSTEAQADTVGESILYFGCGTKNLETQTLNTSANPSDFADWAYYRIFGSTDNTTGNRCTKYYYFYRYGAAQTGVDDRHQSCTRYDNIRLAWRNRLGAWDYMNFRGKSTKSLAIQSSEMESVPGTWDSTAYNYNNWDRGKKTLFKTATQKIVINSDWLNEDEGAWLEELFTSTNIQILDDDYTIVYPIVITDKAYTTKTSVNNKIKIQYTLNLEYSNKVRTNS
tara:strand:- start:7998 stop:9425 length:1428 start_codon:yes stop_codon:yes gene_type:complete